MKRRFYKIGCTLFAAALTLTAVAEVGRALAYFTAYTTASGEAAVNLSFPTTTTTETVSSWTKHVTVQNTGDVDCYVRVKAFAGEEIEAGLVYTDEADKWSPGADGYYYYSDRLAPGEESSELLIKIDHGEGEEDFNVVVIQECTTVLYDEEGQPYYDWNLISDSGEVQG